MDNSNSTCSIHVCNHSSLLSVTDIICNDLPIKGHLFINRKACNATKKGWNPTEEDIVSECKCLRNNTFEIYCRLPCKYKKTHKSFYIFEYLLLMNFNLNLFRLHTDCVKR